MSVIIIIIIIIIIKEKIICVATAWAACRLSGFQFYINMLMDVYRALGSVLKEVFGHRWLEVCFVIVFHLGYHSIDVSGKKPAPSKKQLAQQARLAHWELRKKVHDDATAGDSIGALKAWRKIERHDASCMEL